MHGVDCEIKETPLACVDAIATKTKTVQGYCAEPPRAQLDDSRKIVSPLRKAWGIVSYPYASIYIWVCATNQEIAAGRNLEMRARGAGTCCARPITPEQTGRVDGGVMVSPSKHHHVACILQASCCVVSALDREMVS